MIQAMIDTSSLISLEMIGALEKSFKIVEAVIPKAVESEIKEMKKYNDKEGLSAKNTLKWIKKGFIKVVETKNQRKVENLLSKDVDRGEAECFVCCLEQKIKTLIIDDVDAAYRLEGLAIAREIKIKLSIAVLIELHRTKLLSKSELKKCIRKLIKTRKWEGGALEVLCKKYLHAL